MLVPITAIIAVAAPARAAEVAATDAAAAVPDTSTATNAAAATGSAPTVLQDIVVTVNRSDQRLSKVAASVSAYTPQALEQEHVKTIGDLQGITPGLRFTSGGNTISIRGIASSGAAPTTGVYIDDTPIQLFNVGDSSQNTVPALFDLDRIEVLRGPQGTLFGAGAEGGAVRYITPQPSLTRFSGLAHAELGFIQGGGQDYEAGVAVGGPIVADKIGVRASAYFRNSGGWVDHLSYQTGQDIEHNYNNDHVFNGHLAFKFAPTDKLTVTVSNVLQQRYSQGNAGLFEFYSNPGKGVYENAYASTVPNKDLFWLPSINATYDFGAVELISNSSLFYRNQETGYDGTEYMVRQLNGYSSSFLPGILKPLATAAGLRIPVNYSATGLVLNKQHDYSQEFRLQSTNQDDRLTYVVGLFYANNISQNQERIIDPQLPTITAALTGKTVTQLFGSPLGGYDLVDSYNANNSINDGQTSVFGEFNFKLTSQLKLTAGVRYSSTHFQFNNFQTGPINGGVTTGGVGSQKEQPVTPKFGISYQLDPNNLFYATAVKGFRSGGANAAIPLQACAAGVAQLGLTSAPETYTSDSTMSYELGAKNRLLDRVQIASSVYYIDWKNIQQSTTIPVCAFQYTANNGTAISRGGDIQMSAKVTDNLSVDLQGGYTQAVYTKTLKNGSGATIVNAGDTLGLPPVTIDVAAQYDFSIIEKHTFARLEYRYASQDPGHSITQDPVTTTYDVNIPKPPATSYWTARTGIDVNDWQLAVFVDNLFDSTTILSRSHSSRTWPVYVDTTFRPRTIEMSATYRF